MHKLLTIIIPVYNVEKYLEKCLKSIVEEKDAILECVEIIVIDDGSPDCSGKIADTFAQKYSCMRVIHQKNAGVAEARNVGIRQAQGKWLYFIDSDDWLPQGAITTILEEIQAHEQADILLFDAYKNAKDKQDNWEHFREEEIFAERKQLDALQEAVLYFPILHKESRLKTNIPLAAPWDKVYRSSFVKENELYFCATLKVLDDMVFNAMAFGAAREVVYCKKAIYHYRYVAESITNSYKKDRIEQDKKVWQVLEEYANTQVNTGLWDMERKKEFEQVLYCRKIKSFSICCRLDFFHENNPKTRVQKIAYVREVLKSRTYQEAFDKVKLSNLEWKLKIMAIMGKLKCAYGVYLLHKGQAFLSHYAN